MSTASKVPNPDQERRLHQQAFALHDRGPRATAEFIIEIVREIGLPEWTLARLDEFNGLPAKLYAEVGADRLPPTPLSEVKS